MKARTDGSPRKISGVPKRNTVTATPIVRWPIGCGAFATA